MGVSTIPVRGWIHVAASMAWLLHPLTRMVLTLTYHIYLLPLLVTGYDFLTITASNSVRV